MAELADAQDLGSCPLRGVGSSPTSPTKCGQLAHRGAHIAGVAQLVERDLAKVEVAGSSPVSRSM